MASSTNGNVRWASAWRAEPVPRRWRIYQIALLCLSLPFMARGLLALTELGPYLLCAAALLGALVIASFCIVQLPPFRFLHLLSGFIVLGAFFVLGSAAIGLVVLATAIATTCGRVFARFLPRGRPLGALAEEYSTPLAAMTLLLGLLEASPLAPSYPLRPAGGTAELRFLLTLLGIWVGFIVLGEIGTHLRFGWQRVWQSPHAKSDLGLYVLVTVVGYPIIADLARELGPELSSVLRAQVSILWGLGTFVVIATLVYRRLQIERLARRMAAQERMAALGGLASVVAHQTRHHLGILNMSSYVLGETLAAESQSPDARAVVQRELEAIARTQDELDRLLASELAGGSIEERFGVLELAEECAAGLRPLCEARGVSVAVAGEGAEIRGDRIRLKQAINNLVSNAVQASPAQGQVQVAVSADASEVALTVADRGSGLSEAAKTNLFQPLFTDKPEGLGMGLYVARAIVEAHGGTISLESAGRGTEALIRLPRAT